MIRNALLTINGSDVSEGTTRLAVVLTTSHLTTGSVLQCLLEPVIKLRYQV